MDKKAQEENSSSQNDKISVIRLKQRGSSGETIQVFLSDGSSFFVPEDYQRAHRLKNGKLLETGFIESLKKETSLYNAELKALDLISIRDHSCRQLELKLRKRGFSAGTSLEVVKRLLERGLLNDAAFAENWLLCRLKRHPEGRQVLMGGLMARGIERRTAEEVITRNFSEEIEIEAFNRAAEKAARKYQSREEKFIRAMLRKGFRYALIRSFLERD